MKARDTDGRKRRQEKSDRPCVCPLGCALPVISLLLSVLPLLHVERRSRAHSLEDAAAPQSAAPAARERDGGTEGGGLMDGAQRATSATRRNERNERSARSERN